jgi:hypothetical protein
MNVGGDLRAAAGDVLSAAAFNELVERSETAQGATRQGRGESWLATATGLVAAGAGPGAWLVEATAEEAAGRWRARRVTWAGSGWTAGRPTGLVVRDPLGVVERVGQRAWAMREESSRSWVAVAAMRSLAKWVAITLTAALARTTATATGATVTGYWDGPSPGATVNVANGLGFAGSSGGRGLATWNERQQRYELVQLECPAE